MIGKWLKQILRDFIEKTFTIEFMFKLVTAFFTVLHKIVETIPGGYDDQALADFESKIDKLDVARRMQQALFDLILPGLTAKPLMGADKTITVLDGVKYTDMENEMTTAVAEIHKKAAV